MLKLPQRRQFTTRDDFAAAVSATFQELTARYEAEPVRASKPDWAAGAYNVSLPIDIAREGGAAFALSSLVKQLIEMGKSEIGRLARVETAAEWIVFCEAH